MRQRTISTLFLLLALCAAAAALLLFPQATAQAIQDGLVLCGTTLLPSLFPFFVLSSLVVKLGLAQLLGKALEPLMRPLFHLPGCCATALALGFIGGYPTGAKTAASLYQDGLCSKDEAQRLLSFCNNCGPAFLLSVVGCGIFGSLSYGILLTGVHITAALLTGLIRNCRRATPTHPCKSTPPRSISLSAAFVDSVTESLYALLTLFSFVLCFAAIIQLLRLSGLPAILSQALLPFLTGDNGQTFLLGLLEMTCGATALRDGSITERLVLTSALLGWGGLSVHCQVLALLRDTDLSPIPYLQGKALHAALSALLMAALLWQIDLTCLLTGSGLLLFSCKMSKKSSGKSAEGIV